MAFAVGTFLLVPLSSCAFFEKSLSVNETKTAACERVIAEMINEMNAKDFDCVFDSFTPLAKEKCPLLKEDIKNLSEFCVGAFLEYYPNYPKNKLAISEDPPNGKRKITIFADYVFRTDLEQSYRIRMRLVYRNDLNESETGIEHVYMGRFDGEEKMIPWDATAFGVEIGSDEVRGEINA